MAFAVDLALAEQRAAWRALKLCAIAILSVISVAIHSQGAMAWAPYMWAIQPVSVDQHPERLWDWSDLQFARGVKGFYAMPEFGPLLPGLVVACSFGLTDEPLKLSFGTDWRRPDCPRSGWFGPESWGMWGGAEASLDIAVAADGVPPHGVELIGDVRRVVSPLQRAADVGVFVNGVAVARWLFTTAAPAGERRAAIPAVLVRAHAPLRIVFRAAAARSPAELGLSADGRHLGIGLSRLSISAVR